MHHHHRRLGSARRTVLVLGWVAMNFSKVRHLTAKTRSTQIPKGTQIPRGLSSKKRLKVRTGLGMIRAGLGVGRLVRLSLHLGMLGQLRWCEVDKQARMVKSKTIQHRTLQGKHSTGIFTRGMHWAFLMTHVPAH